MLRLTRKTGRSLVIDGSVIVKIVGVEGARVVLGIQAPPTVAVLRGDARAAQQGVPPPSAIAATGPRTRTTRGGTRVVREGRD